MKRERWIPFSSGITISVMVTQRGGPAAHGWQEPAVSLTRKKGTHSCLLCAEFSSLCPLQFVTLLENRGLGVCLTTHG